MECDECPAPPGHIEPRQQNVQGDDLGFGAARLVIHQALQEGSHRVPCAPHASIGVQTAPFQWHEIEKRASGIRTEPA
jgi:hypothetical protein